jgi:hypothetical protein
VIIVEAGMSLMHISDLTVSSISAIMNVETNGG